VVQKLLNAKLVREMEIVSIVKIRKITEQIAKIHVVNALMEYAI
jgi:hypothetical protein